MENRTETFAAKLVQRLIENELHITTAESCTGGMISSLIVGVPDASKVLSVAFVTYADDAKEFFLEVNPDTIRYYGVVSEETAEEMAKGVAKAAGAECAISVTGYVGPTGGDEFAELGTVCFGYYVDGEVTTETLHFDGSRNENRRQAAEHALEKMLSLIEDMFCFDYCGEKND